MDSLHPGAEYEELKSVRLVGMMLVVAIRQELRKNVVKLTTDSVATGALNFLVSSCTMFIHTVCLMSLIASAFTREIKAALASACK